MADIAETTSLIGGGKVIGTDVYNKDAEIIGKIHDVMIDKRSGQVAYAVLSFGGFLGLGEDYRPIPWRLLTYNSTLGGYVVALERSDLEGAPRHSRGMEDDGNPQDADSDLQGYWGGHQSFA